MRSILLQLHTGAAVRCESWENAPVAHGVQITVYSEASTGDAATLARRTHALLEREIAGLNAVRAPAPCMVTNNMIFPAHTCAGAVQELVGRVLIFVADGSARIDPTMKAYFSARGTVIIPIVDKSIADPPENALPPFMRTRVAKPTVNLDPGPVIPQILRGAGIVASSVRIFISYRHLEAATIAGQLFHELAERSFEPFLDRFCSEPGDDFVTLVREELADKALLLSLETPNIHDSLYCRQEVATAVSRRMGLIALDLPGSKQTFRVIQKRIDATGVTIGPDGKIPERKLKQIVDTIAEIFPHEAARRLRWQDLNLYNALVAARVPFAPEGLGRYLVRSRRTGRERILAMTATLPETDLFIDVEERRDQAGGACGAAIFGPVSAARTSRYREIGWLAKRSGVDAHDEGRLMRYARRL
jgi:TIR domain